MYITGLTRYLKINCDGAFRVKLWVQSLKFCKKMNTFQGTAVGGCLRKESLFVNGTTQF